MYSGCHLISARTFINEMARYITAQALHRTLLIQAHSYWDCSTGHTISICLPDQLEMTGQLLHQSLKQMIEAEMMMLGVPTIDLAKAKAHILFLTLYLARVISMMRRNSLPEESPPPSRPPTPDIPSEYRYRNSRLKAFRSIPKSCFSVGNDTPRPCPDGGRSVRNVTLEVLEPTDESRLSPKSHRVSCPCPDPNLYERTGLTPQWLLTEVRDSIL